MSKLLNLYNELKEKDSNKIYIIKVGIFYNMLNEDARTISNTLNLKLTDLGPEIIKCGFPIAKLDKYTNLLDSKNIKYEIINFTSSSSSNSNMPYEKIIKNIKEINLNRTSPIEAFSILYNIQQKLKNMQ